jgi:hypothetical protein
MNNSFCPETQDTAAGSAGKTGSLSNRFKINIELSALKRRVIVADHDTATEIHYSHDAAHELLNAIAGSLGKSVHPTANIMDEKPWRDELTREERKMEHRVSEQKGGFATLEQLEAWGFDPDAIAECLTTQQRRMLMLPLKPASLADRRLGRIQNRL